jgi:hypothetical protein
MSEKFKERLYDFIMDRRQVTFAEIEDEYGQGSELYGPLDRNIVFWNNVRKDVSDALTELFRDKRISIKSCEERFYAIEGKGIDLPIVQDHSIRKFDEPHWDPVLITPKKK